MRISDVCRSSRNAGTPLTVEVITVLAVTVAAVGDVVESSTEMGG